MSYARPRSPRSRPANFGDLRQYDQMAILLLATKTWTNALQAGFDPSELTQEDAGGEQGSHNSLDGD